MALSYHETKILAQRAMDAARKNPDHGGRLRRADTHYEDGPLKHSMVHLLTQPDIETAIRRVMEDRDVVRSIARSSIISAIENAPEAWQKDNKFLYSLGFMKIGKQFFVLPADLLKDSLFDKTRERLSTDAQKILDETLRAALSGKMSGVISVGTTTVQYVAAQLITDQLEREFRLSALSVKRSKQVDADHIYNSTRAIRHFAAELNIDLAEIGVSLREGESKASKPQASAPEKSSIALPLRRLHQQAGVQSPRYCDNDAIDAKVELRRALERLVKAESITLEDASVYFFVAGAVRPADETMEKAAKKYGISPEEVSIIVDEVNEVLYSSQPPEPQKLTVRR